LWGRVAHYLYDDVPALLALRAVCSDCTAELTPLAFRVVWFHDTPASVQRLKGLRAGGVVAHLFRHVRQARVLVKGAPPSAPPKRRSRLGHSFARLLNRREEPAPLAARDASAQTFKGECTVQCRSGQGMFWRAPDAADCAERLWAAFDSRAWLALTKVDVVFAHAPAEAIEAFISRALFGYHEFDVCLSDVAAPGYAIVGTALCCGEVVFRPYVRAPRGAENHDGEWTGMPTWLRAWQRASGLPMESEAWW
jgi:hypothetical protein